MENNGLQMAFFPASHNGVGGCVTYGNGNKPNAEGTIVYLNGGDDLAKPLSKVEKAGGKVMMPKLPSGPMASWPLSQIQRATVLRFTP